MPGGEPIQTTLNAMQVSTDLRVSFPAVLGGTAARITKRRAWSGAAWLAHSSQHLLCGRCANDHKQARAGHIPAATLDPAVTPTARDDCSAQRWDRVEGEYAGPHRGRERAQPSLPPVVSFGRCPRG